MLSDPCVMHEWHREARSRNYVGLRLKGGATIADMMQDRYSWRTSDKDRLLEGWWPVVHSVAVTRTEGDPTQFVGVEVGFAERVDFDDFQPPIAMERVLYAPVWPPPNLGYTRRYGDRYGIVVPAWQGQPMDLWVDSQNNSGDAGVGANLRLDVTWSWRRIGEISV